MVNEYKTSLEIVLASMVGAVLGAWTTTLFEGFSWKGFFWIIGGSGILFLIIAWILIIVNKRNKKYDKKIK